MSIFDKTIDLFSKEYFGENLFEESILNEHSNPVNDRIEVLGSVLEEIGNDPIIEMALWVYKNTELCENSEVVITIDTVVTERLKSLDSK